MMHNKTFVYIEMNLHCLLLHWRLLCNQLYTKNTLKIILRDYKILMLRR